MGNTQSVLEEARVPRISGTLHSLSCKMNTPVARRDLPAFYTFHCTPYNWCPLTDGGGEKLGNSRRLCRSLFTINLFISKLEAKRYLVGKGATVTPLINLHWKVKLCDAMDGSVVLHRGPASLVFQSLSFVRACRRARVNARAERDQGRQVSVGDALVRAHLLALMVSSLITDGSQDVGWKNPEAVSAVARSNFQLRYSCFLGRGKTARLESLSRVPLF